MINSTKSGTALSIRCRPRVPADDEPGLHGRPATIVTFDLFGSRTTVRLSFCGRALRSHCSFYRGRSAELEAAARAHSRRARIMAFRAPGEDIIFNLKHGAGFAKARADGLYQ